MGIFEIAMKAARHICVVFSAALFLQPLFKQGPPNPAQPTPWLTDEQAREVAAAAIRSVYPRPCYSTYRNEHLESFLLSIRKNPLASNRLNNSVYFYRVASDVCEYVVEENGKHILMSQASMDCCDYGIVAVDRASAKSYWFAGKRESN